MVQELGFEVVGQANDGFDAIELCRVKRPDIVLMDVKMPIFDGLTASETILSEELAGCVVLLTAFSDHDIIARANAAGVTGYLVKPIDQKSLLPTMEVALAQSLSLRRSRMETQKAQQKLRDDRQIHKAQQYLAKKQNCSETEAYRIMRKTAMDKRISMISLAEHILRQAAQTDNVEAVKKFLITQKNMSDTQAYHYIVSYGKSHGYSVEEAANQLQRHFSPEM